MKEIKAEGTTFVFVPKKSQAEGLKQAKTVSARFDAEKAVKILSAPNVRLALFRSLLPPNGLVPYYLVWAKDSGFAGVDEKVAHGKFSDDDFAPAIRTHFQTTVCLGCQSKYDSLVVDSGDPYPQAPELLQEKIGKLNVELCPKCGASLRQLVVQFV